MPRQPKRKPLDPRVRYQTVARDWDWVNSPWAEGMLISEHTTVEEAERDRDLSRELGARRERIIRVTTVIEVVDEGDDSKITGSWMASRLWPKPAGTLAEPAVGPQEDSQ